MRVFVSDCVADRVDRLGGPLEPAFRLFDANVLDVGDRRVPGRSGESSFERPLRQPGALDQLGDGCGDRVGRPQPLLRLEHDRVAVVARRRRTARTAPGRRCATAGAGTSQPPAPPSGRRGARRGTGRGRARTRTRPLSRTPRARRRRPGSPRGGAERPGSCSGRWRRTRGASSRRGPRAGPSRRSAARPSRPSRRGLPPRARGCSHATSSG